MMLLKIVPSAFYVSESRYGRCECGFDVVVAREKEAGSDYPGNRGNPGPADYPGQTGNHYPASGNTTSCAYAGQPFLRNASSTVKIDDTTF